MKNPMAAAIALIMLTSTPVLSQEVTPSMDVEIVSQDASDTAADDGMLVPILTMIFIGFGAR